MYTYLWWTYSLRACAFAMLLPFLRTSKLQMDSTQIRPSFVALGGKQQPQEPLEKQKVDCNKSITIRSNISQMLGALNVSLNITLLPQERKVLVPRFTFLGVLRGDFAALKGCSCISMYLRDIFLNVRHVCVCTVSQLSYQTRFCAQKDNLRSHGSFMTTSSTRSFWGRYLHLGLFQNDYSRSSVWPDADRAHTFARPLRKWMVLGRSLIKFM